MNEQDATFPWVSVDERLPDTDREVLVWREDDECKVARYLPNKGYWLTISTVTHWCDITPPQRQKGKRG